MNKGFLAIGTLAAALGTATPVVAECTSDDGAEGGVDCTVGNRRGEFDGALYNTQPFDETREGFEGILKVLDAVDGTCEPMQSPSTSPVLVAPDVILGGGPGFKVTN